MTTAQIRVSNTNGTTSNPFGSHYALILHPKYGRIWVGIETISPATAEEYLKELAPLQRRPKKNHLESMIRDMKDGRFVFTGEPIIFDEDGKLIQGQHRMMACVKSGVSFDTLVVRGVPSSAYKAIDIVAKRSATDALTHDGQENAAVVAAIAGKVASFERGMKDTDLAVHSPIVILETTQRNAEALQHAARAAGRLKKLRQGARIPGYAYWRFSRIDHHATALFFDRLATGEQLERGNPILTLRNHMINQEANSTTLLRVFYMAWNAWRAGKAMQLIRYKEGDPLPDLI
jgi:hypothetical protein